MTVYTLQAPMPEINLVSGMLIKLEAIDPTTGAAATGVVATNWAIYGIDMSAVLDELQDLVPALTRDEVQNYEV
jgi:hypothetical protein